MLCNKSLQRFQWTARMNVYCSKLCELASWLGFRSNPSLLLIYSLLEPRLKDEPLVGMGSSSHDARWDCEWPSQSNAHWKLLVRCDVWSDFSHSIGQSNMTMWHRERICSSDIWQEWREMEELWKNRAIYRTYIFSIYVEILCVCIFIYVCISDQRYCLFNDRIKLKRSSGEGHSIYELQWT